MSRAGPCEDCGVRPLALSRDGDIEFICGCNIDEMPENELLDCISEPFAETVVTAVRAMLRHHDRRAVKQLIDTIADTVSLRVDDEGNLATQSMTVTDRSTDEAVEQTLDLTRE